MAPEPNYKHKSPTSLTKVADDGHKAPVEGTADKNKTSRHSRWTRHETLVLIEGKKAAEERGRKGSRSSSGFGSDQIEPKWDSVSSYCRQRGVNRGPVQCRKRWSNLVGDFRKIKTWESLVKEEGESFWMLRNDLRREKKLPSFFDKEVFDVLDGRAFTTEAYQLALVTVSAGTKDDEGEEVPVTEEDEGEEEDEEGEAVFDSCRHAAAEDALFSESEQLVQEENEKSPEKERVMTDSATKTIPSPVPISEKHYQPFHQLYTTQGNVKEKQPGSYFWRGSAPHEGCKRRRVSIDGSRDANLEDRLINVLEKNTGVLSAQLEAQNINLQLDRNQRKDHNDSLVDALKKVTDALIRVADKLTKDNGDI